MKWCVLWTGWSDGGWNMALDDWLLTTARLRPPTLRIYGWRCPTVSLGRNERWQKVVRLDRLAQARARLVRRPTGGRAVLHHRELTYSVTAPHSREDRLGGRLEETLASISEALVKAFSDLGVAATIVRRQRPAGRQEGLCFESTARYELVADGHKVAGNAQYRTAAGFLQHGSIPVFSPLAPLERLGPRLGVAATDADPGTPLADWGRLPLDVLGRSLVGGFRGRFGGGAVWLPRHRIDREGVRALLIRRYANPEWTFRR
jgi:lipoate-protein ligase A